jgi:hypothetical protein
MALDPMIARGSQPIDVTNTLAQIAALRQRDQGLQQSAQQNALYQRKYDDAQAAQAKEDEEDELVGSLLREGRLDEAFAIDPDTASAYAQFKGIDPQTLIAKQRLTQDQSQFETRMGADQQQFNARMALDRQQEARLSRAAPDAPKPQLVDVPMPDGTVQKQWLTPGQSAGTPVGAPAPKAENQPKPPTESDKKVGTLYGALVGAEKTIAGLSGGTTTASKTDAVLGSTPVTRIFQSDDFRKYESAALRWSANLLYIKSGATATPEEVRSTYKQFFPQPGDGDEVISQKNASRQEEMANVRSQYPGVTSGYEVPGGNQSKAAQGGKAPPKPGDNVRGYIFIGGNPADKSRWVKAR